VRYLLDTGVFLWCAFAPERLNARAAKILSTESEVYLSPANSWEIAIKFILGKLPLPRKPSELIPEAMRKLALRPLDITHVHALVSGELRPHHRDPFDRMLIAQASAENMVLLTGDNLFKAYDVSMMMCGR
jgi:PIN domain nuclease of toxin-antitoxin system